MVKRINIALQGGGAHGAYTWGVLDRLLECEELEIAAISGTSAGALNGAALKAGLVYDRTRARENLDWLWSRIAGVADFKIASWLNPFAPGTAQIARAIEYSPPYMIADYLSQTTSPYALGPFYQNALEPIVRHFNFDNICCDTNPPFYIGATNVRSGKVRVFTGDDISPEAIMASACLPTLFQAVEIDGEAYWDGGYTGNPPLFPLYDADLPDDLVVININPIERPELPYTPQEIINRINEISFNSSLLRDLRAIRFVQRLIEGGQVQKGAMKYVLVHMIKDDELMRQLSAATKTVPSPILIRRLKIAGRQAADQFLADHWDDIGERCSIDLAAMYD